MFKVVPPSVRAAQLANPFMVPDFTDAEKRKSTERRLVGWELITPLLNSFEQAPNGAPACMALPEPKTSLSYRGQRSDEHTSELQSLMRISYAVFCLKKKTLYSIHKKRTN